MNLTCIILAAGKSTRMKQQKMLLPFKGSTVIENVVTASIQSNVKHTIVVTGSQQELISQQLKSLDVEIIQNAKFEDGMLSSVQCGVMALRQCDAFLVLPGDQALVKSTSINHLIKMYDDSQKGLLIPTYYDRKGHPVIIDSKYKNQIMKLDHSIGLRQLFHENEDDLALVPIDSNEILIDLDLPEDYQKALKQLQDEN